MNACAVVVNLIMHLCPVFLALTTNKQRWLSKFEENEKSTFPCAVVIHHIDDACGVSINLVKSTCASVERVPRCAVECRLLLGIQKKVEI